MKFKQNIQRKNKERIVLLNSLQKKLACILLLDIQIYVVSLPPAFLLLSICKSLCFSALLNVAAKNYFSFGSCLPCPLPHLIHFILILEKNICVATAHLKGDSGVDFLKMISEFLIGRPGE